MASQEEVPTEQDEDKTIRANISFPDPTEMQEMFPDVELDDEISITIKAKVTGMHMDRGEQFKHGALELEVVSINGESAGQKTDREERDDMTEDKE